VLRKAHTEVAFTGAYVHNHRDGFYRCAGSGAQLFSSDAKFNSGTGWPSFDQPEVRAAHRPLAHPPAHHRQPRQNRRHRPCSAGPHPFRARLDHVNFTEITSVMLDGF
jgi:peptide methionine sulfoxide reductase MsrB